MIRAASQTVGMVSEPLSISGRGGTKIGMKLSIVIPVYNEHAFIEEVLARVQAAPFEKEILVIDDGSIDGTRALLQTFEQARAAGLDVKGHVR